LATACSPTNGADNMLIVFSAEQLMKPAVDRDL